MMDLPELFVLDYESAKVLILANREGLCISDASNILYFSLNDIMDAFHDAYKRQHIVKCLANLCNDHILYIVLSSDKYVYCFNVVSERIRVISRHQTERRCSSLSVNYDCTQVLCADKSGLVYSFPVFNNQSNDTSNSSDSGTSVKPILGHVSMLLSICCIKNLAGDEYVVTSDRDEKIRISSYPDTHTIVSYCLGHEDYVHCLKYWRAADLLLSGSGDGTVRIWSYSSGIQLLKVHISPEDSKPNFAAGVMDEIKKPLVDFAVTDGNPALLMLAMEDSHFLYLFQVTISEGSVRSKRICKHQMPFQPIALASVTFQPDADKLPQSSFLVLMQSEKSPLMSLTLEENQLVYSSYPNLDSLNRVVSDKFTFEDPKLSASLSKAHYDNLTAYYERKKKRIEGQSKSEFDAEVT